MVNLFKKNPPLFIGLALPLLMLLIFVGIPFISSYLVPAPQYNFIYSLYNTGSEGTLRVVDGKLILNIYNSQDQPLKPRQQFYLVDIVSKKSTKLNFFPSTSKDIIIPPLKS
ncbi:MAG: hypothetical protein IBJ00_08000, partial [Alphaproteobacteria bacterium]|nr:hypothetical protein [Alphaproteobacteria bacterium]